MKNLWPLVLVAFLVGCMQPEQEIVVPEPTPIVVPVPDSPAAVTLTVASDSYDEILSWLGESNSVTLEKPHKIVHSEIGLDLKANTKTSWVTGPQHTIFSFSPSPNITSSAIAKLLGLTLRDLQINSDGSGIATVSGGIHRGFRWARATDAEEIAAIEELPEVWMWTHDGCVHCRRFDKDYEEHKKDCGFKVVKKHGERPPWMSGSDPQFWWHISGKQPSQEEVESTRHQNGYPGWKDFLAKFKHSREPKKARAGGPVSRPFVQRDQPDTRAVARNGISYNPTHTCPRCGRTQYVIENDAGPNHTHRCGHCSSVWFHRDQ